MSLVRYGLGKHAKLPDEPCLVNKISIPAHQMQQHNQPIPFLQSLRPLLSLLPKIVFRSLLVWL